MKPAEAASTPLHFIIPGKPTWRHIRECRQQAKEVAALYAGATCHIWHGKALREQIRCSFGEEVAAVFDGMPSDADTAALASWCLLHMFGGLFHALGPRLLAPMKIPAGSGVAAFNNVGPSSPGWTINTAILWSRPGRREWTSAIDMKIKAWREAPSRLPPDPVILAHAFGLAAVEMGGRSEDDQWIGQVTVIPGTTGATECQAFVVPDGTIVALL